MPHAANQACPYCEGTGIDIKKTENLRARGIIAPEADIDCMCTYVEHENVEMVRKAFQETVEQLRKEMEENSPRHQAAVQTAQNLAAHLTGQSKNCAHFRSQHGACPYGPDYSACKERCSVRKG